MNRDLPRLVASPNATVFDDGDLLLAIDASTAPPRVRLLSDRARALEVLTSHGQFEPLTEDPVLQELIAAGILQGGDSRSHSAPDGTLGIVYLLPSLQWDHEWLDEISEHLTTRLPGMSRSAVVTLTFSEPCAGIAIRAELVSAIGRLRERWNAVRVEIATRDLSDAVQLASDGPDWLQCALLVNADSEDWRKVESVAASLRDAVSAKRLRAVVEFDHVETVEAALEKWTNALPGFSIGVRPSSKKLASAEPRSLAQELSRHLEKFLLRRSETVEPWRSIVENVTLGGARVLRGQAIEYVSVGTSKRSSGQSTALRLDLPEGDRLPACVRCSSAPLCPGFETPRFHALMSSGCSDVALALANFDCELKILSIDAMCGALASVIRARRDAGTARVTVRGFGSGQLEFQQEVIHGTFGS